MSNLLKKKKINASNIGTGKAQINTRIFDLGKVVNDLAAEGTARYGKELSDTARLTNIIGAEKAAETLLAIKDRVPDPNSRSMGAFMSDDISKMPRDIKTHLKNFSSIASIAAIQDIHGLPPMPDNVVDPPAMYSEDEIKGELTSFGSGMVGRNYIQKVLARGQFLTLVPLDLVPNLTGAIEESSLLSRATNAAKKLANGAVNVLSTVDKRLNQTSYGLYTKVNSIKHGRSSSALLRTASMALGIDFASDNSSYQMDFLRKYLPDYMVDKLFEMNATTLKQRGLFQHLAGSGESATAVNPDQSGARAQTTAGVGTFRNRGNSKTASKVANKGTFQSGANKASMISVDTTEPDLKEIVKRNEISNLVKWITNIDDTDQANKNLPFLIFYCNGPIERGWSNSVNVGESAIARQTTDVVSRGLKSVTGILVNSGNDTAKVAGAAGQEMAQAGEDYVRELAYHRGLGSFLVSNTVIPSVIKNATMDQTYSASVRCIAAGSDRFSILRMMYAACDLIPFTTPTNEAGQQLIVPSTPMYVAAFSKGIMNLPRAAITSMSIKTSPEFQTTEGIPVELDINITIQPLINASAMPDMDKWYDGTAHPDFLAAAVFNPLGAFSNIATLCGQNTVLSKFTAGLFDFFITGTVSNVISMVKNSGNIISTSWRDSRASASVLSSQVYSTVRII